MIDTGESVEEDIVTAEELTDLAFGMFSIFANQRLATDGKYLFSEIEKTDARETFTGLVTAFGVQYPELAEPLDMFGTVDDILGFYRFGEGIVPTRTTHSYWIWQIAPGIDVNACSLDEAGKWLIFLTPSEADEAWVAIRDATIAGNLGIGAKVSTARQNPDSRDNRKVIYVFTKNWEDEADVMRVRETLKTLGFVDRIGYKRNIDTYAGEYREKGKRVTFYSV